MQQKKKEDMQRKKKKKEKETLFQTAPLTSTCPLSHGLFLSL